MRVSNSLTRIICLQIGTIILAKSQSAFTKTIIFSQNLLHVHVRIHAFKHAAGMRAKSVIWAR